MSFERYKKRMEISGGSIAKERTKDNRISIINAFEDCPSYRLGLLKKSDLSVEEVQIRMINVDKTTFEKKLYLLPNDIAEVGDYIFCDNKYYIILEFEDNIISPYAKVTQCNLMLKWRDEKGEIIEYPCLGTNDSFGVKLTSSNEFIQENDVKLKIKVQNNIDTLGLDSGYRFIFNQSKHNIYKIGKIDSAIINGIITLTCENDVAISEDDIQNNLAFNGTVTPPTPTTYTITGSPTIRVNTSTTYTLTPPTTDVTWELDSTIATITNQDTNTCTVKANVMDEIVILTAKQNGVVLGTFVIQTMR